MGTTFYEINPALRMRKTSSSVAGILTGLCILIGLTVSSARSQSGQAFDLAAYRDFLNAHQNLTSEQLRSLYPAGTFAAKAVTILDNARYADSIQLKYDLTSYEKSLIQSNGFMVSERLKRSSFAEAFLEIYQYDLPVFVSSDAILHAIHMSYDAMLMDIEKMYLAQKLDALLASLHAQVPTLAARYASTPAMKRSLQDIDIYLTVPRMLLGDAVSCSFPEDADAVSTLLNYIKAEMPQGYKLFSSQERTIDFSQFTVRGHYTQSEKLGQYFQAMIWLGRTEIYLCSPKHTLPEVVDSNIQRQAIDAALLVEAAQGADAFGSLEEIDRVLRYFVGESDNVTLPNVQSLLQATATGNAAELLDTLKFKGFQDTLRVKAFAFQRILSQSLFSDPMDPESVQPASAFLLLGQRFIIDSYLTGNVVYDKIIYNNDKVWRGLPSTFDVLFSLGNDAAAQLLEPQLEAYHYSTNLAALRYLVDAYEPGFWKSTLYNSWLNTIRALNPPSDRSAFPLFLKTAAWWQEKMNTQLASWAQLRHDNLLYAKQSYTSGTTCSYPYSYVEPIPDFFKAVSALATSASSAFDTLLTGTTRAWMTSYWDHLKGVADTLGSIAQKEVSGTMLTDRERAFLQQMLYTQQVICGGNPYDGWYYSLYYTGEVGFLKKDLVVADVHTCPTDEAGSPVGWVLHVGTGPINLGVVVARTDDGWETAFIGPVMSYYEHVSTNFKRLTDEEWKTEYQVSPSFRPDFVNLYLADSAGTQRPGVAPSLMTSVQVLPDNPAVPSTIVLGKNFPNPFNASTIITFSIPQSLSNSNVELWIHNILGQRIKRILNRPMPAGKYAAQWDGTGEGGSTVASGVYFYSLRIGSHLLTEKMSLVK